MKKGSFVFVCIVLLIGVAVWAPNSGAFEQYKEGCKNCHGSFTDFFSAKPGNDWFPSNKHFGHDQMLNQNPMGCDLCHRQGNFDRTMTFDCLGCHGTTTTDITGPLTGAGLRAHHATAGITDCYACHADQPPQPESFMPIWYGTTLTFITDPCNSDGSESWSSDGLGLDNDGDGLYDGADPDCGNVIPCTTNSDCLPADFCKKAAGDCGGEGVCQPRPELCVTIVDPVCGCDSITYPSECEADLAGVSVAYTGECVPTIPLCPDADNDGYAVCDSICDPVGNLCGDCDDTDTLINPAATEECDAVDNNCGGIIDEGFDLDNDGYTECAGDCDDNDPDINTGASEVCDGIDNNCDTIIDEGFDADADGYTTCGGDCNDDDPLANPGAPEICDGIDNDCNTGTVDGSDENWYGTPTSCGLGICSSTGYLTCVAGVKDDTCIPGTTDADREKGKTCKDGIDNDCDGSTDASDTDCEGGGDTGGTEGKGKTCSDGVDNDGDGDIDCVDPDCWGNNKCK